MISITEIDIEFFDPYFPPTDTPNYEDIVYCLESLYFEVVTSEEEYKNDGIMRAICPAEHGVVEVKLSSLREGSQCCQKCSQERHKMTMVIRYGVENASHSQVLLDKAKATNLIRYGVENAAQSEAIKEKKKQACLETWGVDHPMKTEEIKEKKKQTTLKIYGVENPMQDREVFQRQAVKAYSYKSYTFPSGKKGHVQGYENFCLDDLFHKENYQEEDVTNDSSEIPEIWYSYEDKPKRYYPDIFIRSENKIIEVKSDYTLKLNNEKNVAKAKKCVELGYQFEFRIYDVKGNLIKTIIY